MFMYCPHTFSRHGLDCCAPAIVWPSLVVRTAQAGQSSAHDGCWWTCSLLLLALLLYHSVYLYVTSLKTYSCW